MNTISHNKSLILRAPSTMKVFKEVKTETKPDRFEGGRSMIESASGVYTKLASTWGGMSLAGTLGLKAGLAATALVGGAAAAASLPGLAVAGGVALASGVVGAFVGSKVGDAIDSEFGKLGEKASAKLGGSPKWLKTGAKAAGALALTAAAGLNLPLTAGLMVGLGGLGALFAKGETSTQVVEVKDQAKRQVAFDSLDSNTRGEVLKSEATEAYVNI